MDSDAEGAESEAFNYFKRLCIHGFLACRKHAERIIVLIEMMQVRPSTSRCWQEAGRMQCQVLFCEQCSRLCKIDEADAQGVAFQRVRRL
jgi:phosphatidylinositol kinase/protein kinase (PI-3  family)